MQDDNEVKIELTIDKCVLEDLQALANEKDCDVQTLIMDFILAKV